jgi:hypothetical protein
MEWWLGYAAIGAAVGFFAGLLGIGGGAIMVPLLVMLFEAQGLQGTYCISRRQRHDTCSLVVEHARPRGRGAVLDRAAPTPNTIGGLLGSAITA